LLGLINTGMICHTVVLQYWWIKYWH